MSMGQIVENGDDVRIPFLDPDPPHWAARGLAYILILFFTVVAVASAVVEVPETVSGSFVLVPRRGTDPVRSLRNGVVREVLVQEGAQVREGETLFVLHSEPVAGFTAELGVIESEIKGASTSLTNARSRYERQRMADVERERQLQTRLAGLDRAVELKRRQLAITRDLAGRHRRTLEMGLISPAEYSKVELDIERMVLEFDQSEAERAEAEASLEALRHEVVAKEVEFEELRRSLNEQAERGRIRRTPLEQALANSSGSQLTVTSPCAGAIVRQSVKAAGAIVQESDVLAEIACADERLQAALSVPQSGLALLKEGQGVKLLYDAFPYQRYGVRPGVVRFISPTGDTEKSGGAFRVLADLEDDDILVNGDRRPLMAGMGGRADVVVGRRSLISFAFEPVRQLRENMAEVPGR
jgi:membrane fusion protein